MSKPTTGDAARLKRASRYLAGTKEMVSFVVPNRADNITLVMKSSARRTTAMTAELAQYQKRRMK